MKSLNFLFTQILLLQKQSRLGQKIRIEDKKFNVFHFYLNYLIA